MSIPKLLFVTATLLFAAIGIAVLMKGEKEQASEKTVSALNTPMEVELESEIRIAPPAADKQAIPLSQDGSVPHLTANPKTQLPSPPLPDANRIDEFFNKGTPKLPIVETITYKSRVAWQKGRPAWLSDYATHYSTSRHFIARSLNGKPDYFKQDIAEGDRFNVLRKDKNINFYFLVDSSLCRMWFYYIDLDTNERVLLKSYQVGLGRIDNSNSSGMLTPLGKYQLGDNIAIYKPKMMGMRNGEKIEMIRIFGSRWIPFGKELSNTNDSFKGIGIHGVPWVPNDKGVLAQDCSSIGKYESDGCIHLKTQDMEEIFAIIITKPTIIEIVKSFNEANLPGIERQ